MNENEEDEIKGWARDIESAIKITKKTLDELERRYYKYSFFKEPQWSDPYTKALNIHLSIAQEELEKALTSIGGYWFYRTKQNPQES